MLNVNTSESFMEYIWLSTIVTELEIKLSAVDQISMCKLSLVVTNQKRIVTQIYSHLMLILTEHQILVFFLKLLCHRYVHATHWVIAILDLCSSWRSLMKKRFLISMRVLPGHSDKITDQPGTIICDF